MKNSSPELSRGILSEQVGFNLRIAYNLVALFFSEAFSELMISPLQFAILEVALNNKNLSQRELAELIGSQPSVLVKPSLDLEKRGLLERDRLEDDRRQYRIRLTKDGEAMQAQARQKIRAVETKLTQTLTNEERLTLLHLLKKMNQR